MRWVVIAFLCRLSLAAASGDFSVVCGQWPLVLPNAGCRHTRVSRCSSRALECCLSSSGAQARGIFPDQESNPPPMHWQADSYSLSCQGSPRVPSLIHEALLSTCCSKGTVLGPRIRLRRTWHYYYFFKSLHPKVERKYVHKCSPDILFSGPRGVCLLHSFCLECPFSDFLRISPLSLETESKVSSFVKTSMMLLPVSPLLLYSTVISSLSYYIVVVRFFACLFFETVGSWGRDHVLIIWADVALRMRPRTD